MKRFPRSTPLNRTLLYIYIGLCCFAALLILGGMIGVNAVWHRLPETLGYHFDVDGNFNLYGDKSIAFIHPFVAEIVVLLLFGGLGFIALRMRGLKRLSAAANAVATGGCAMLAAANYLIWIGFFCHWLYCVCTQTPINTKAATALIDLSFSAFIAYFILLITLLISSHARDKKRGTTSAVDGDENDVAIESKTILFYNEYCSHEYQRLLSECTDLPTKHPLVNMSDVLGAYFALTDYFTDDTAEASPEQMLVGVRSTDLLYSALSRQTVEYAGARKYTEPMDICATLFFGLVKNHAFADGNKRVALLTLLYQLRLFGYAPGATPERYERLVLAVAANELPQTYPTIWGQHTADDDPAVGTIAHLLREATEPLSCEPTCTMHALCEVAARHGITARTDGANMRFTRGASSCALPFAGRTRMVGITDVVAFEAAFGPIDVYDDQAQDERVFYDCIQRFEAPLRRLKDE